MDGQFNNQQNNPQNNNNSNNNSNNSNSGSHIPNMNVVKGLLAIIFGLGFIMLAAKIIANVIFFVGGVCLVYYGLRVLNMRQATDYVDRIFAKIKSFLPL